MLSNLVSLNVHEPLTFEGAEICLHPDLFLNSQSNNQHHGGGGGGPSDSASFISSTHTTPQQQHHKTKGIAIALAQTMSSEEQQQHKNATSSVGGATSSSTAAGPPSEQQQQQQQPLQVGDMIEIRVWDPLVPRTSPPAPTTTMSTNPPSMRKRLPPPPPPPPPMSSPSAMSTAASSAAAAAAAAAVAGGEESEKPDSELQQKTSSAGATPISAVSSKVSSQQSKESMQYSEVSGLSVGGEHSVETSSTIPPPPPPPPPPDHPASTSSLVEGGVAAAGSSSAANSSSTSLAGTSVVPETARDHGSSSSTTPPRLSPPEETIAAASNKDADILSSSASSAADQQQQQQQSQSKRSSPKEERPTPMAGGSPRPSPSSTANSNDGGGAADALPKVITSGLLPPVFPRSRASTVEGPLTTTAAAVATTTTTTTTAAAAARNTSKNTISYRRTPPPPGVPESAPSFPTTGTATGTGVVATRAPRTAFHQKSRHFRELSDMTVDTIAADAISRTTTILDANHQLVDLQVPLAPGRSSEDDDVDDEEDEDMWTQLLSSHHLRLSFVMLVTEKSLTSLKSSARTQVSLLRQVADLYQLSSYDMVTIHKIDQDEREKALAEVSADFVLVTIKDQFLSRGDLHFFQKDLIGTWIYEGQRLHEPTRDILANAREIRHGGSLARSGIITENTLITYRSRSARIFWLVQLSSEMWDYASPYRRSSQDESLCEIYFDKFISFVYQLFQKWKEVEATHSLTVVFFSRTFLGTRMPGGAGGGRGPNRSAMTDQQDVYGRRYEDHCKVVIENETRTDWNSMVLRIREAFSKYPAEVGWNLKTREETRRPSSASQGNVLEAINVTLNLLQKHYLDRDLHRTGNSIVVVSAGNGVFEVDKGLANITYQRMMDHGIGSDMLSLGLPPLHIAPFFLYINEYQGVESEGVIDSAETYFEVPHWMHLSFVDYKSDTNVPTETRANEEGELDAETGQSPLDIGPNGFLRRRFTNKTSRQIGPQVGNPLDHHPTSFSVVGNAAASPAFKKQARRNQERQLISGRDFGDILEACRPRHAGTLPTPLKALIDMYAAGENRIPMKSIEPEGLANDTASALEEWGALDIDGEASESSIVVNRRLALVHDPKDRPSPLFLARSPPRVDELDSQSSSYTSASSCRLGVSYDRPFLAHQTSPTLAGIQMQRAPSLEMDHDEDSETALSEKSDQSGDASEDGNSIETNRFSTRLLKSMQSHDSNVVVPRSPRANPRQELDRSRHAVERSLIRPGQNTSPRSGPQTSNLAGSLSVTIRTGTTEGQPAAAGGIGAALMQYGGTATSSPDAGNANNPMLRSSSTGRIPLSISPGALGRIPERPPGVSPLPPLLLPPGALPIYNHQSDDRRRDVVSSLAAGRFIPPQRSLAGAEWGSVLPRNDSFLQSMSHVVASQSSLPRAVPTSPEKKARAVGGFSASPPRVLTSSTRGRVDRSAAQNRMASRDPPGARSRHGPGSRRKKAFNPFRQQDEDEVLARKSHNRLRWSHVFPLGEVEFKRHAGPNWRSLSAPAILPLSIDYFPPKGDIQHNFTFSIYNVTLSEFERKLYSSNKGLLMEMVRQRITQDYQLVPDTLVKEYDKKYTLGDALFERDRKANSRSKEHPDSIRIFLSMGHRLQILSYDPSNDTVEVTRYTTKDSQRKTPNTSYKYSFLSFSQHTNSFVPVVQTFDKFSMQYNWNKVDRIICGDEDREMRDGMKFKRIMFAVIPPRFESEDAEKSHVAKFKRLLEYLEKLREKDESSRPLNIKIVSSADKKSPNKGQQLGEQVLSTPGIAGSSMVRFYVQLRKGKSEVLEWMEVAVDSTFDTTWTYRIMFHWLVASSGKVDTQVQLLQRRCTQYGLNLLPFLQASVSRNLFLNPFRAPTIFTVRDEKKAVMLDSTLRAIDFIHDGVFYTDARSIAECVQDGKLEFDFGKRWSKPPAGRQFVHRSGSLFARIISDKKGWALVVVFDNYRCTTRTDDSMKKQSNQAFQALQRSLELLLDRPGDASSSSSRTGATTATSSTTTTSPIRRSIRDNQE